MLHVFSESLLTLVLGFLGSEELRHPAEGWRGSWSHARESWEEGRAGRSLGL